MTRSKSCSALTVAVVAALLLTPGPGGQADPSRPFSPDGNMARSKIPGRFKWNLDQLFKSDRAFEKGLKQAAKKRKALARFKGKLAAPARPPPA